MKQLSIFFISLFLIGSLAVRAQYTVSGTIVDSATKEPLSAASVFCQNTTIGTTTDKQGQFTLQLKSSGGYELIVTYTGYRTQQLRITHDDKTVPTIEMVKEDKSMNEVVIKSSNEVPDGWEKYGGFFVEHFIGSTANAAKCVLQNPEALKFYFLKKSNKLKVLATEPLRISNYALGYNLTYSLDSFIYYYNNDINLYRGYCLYSEMDSSFSAKKTWSTNREKTYLGSKLHFMRSYYDSSLKTEGFFIALLDEKNETKFNPVANPYDSAYYGGVDSTGEVEIWYPRKISITYGVKPEPGYLKKFKMPASVAVQTSYIDIKDWIGIKENGYYYDQKDWVNQGYWSWKNLGDQLPYDYIP